MRNLHRQKDTNLMSSNSPSGGMKLILCSVSNLLNLTHWWNWQSSIAMDVFPVLQTRTHKQIISNQQIVHTRLIINKRQTLCFPWWFFLSRIHVASTNCLGRRSITEQNIPTFSPKPVSLVWPKANVDDQVISKWKQICIQMFLFCFEVMIVGNVFAFFGLHGNI